VRCRPIPSRHSHHVLQQRIILADCDKKLVPNSRGGRLASRCFRVNIHQRPIPSCFTTSPLLGHPPLSVQLDPGVAVYSQSMYSGQGTFTKLPESPIGNLSLGDISGVSIAISSNVSIAVSINNNRFVLWDSIPDISQLPSTGPLALLSVQSSGCNPPCAGSSICSTTGKCTCPDGFTGSLCETCQDGFFGPTCKLCPRDCDACDRGISGTGRCLRPNTPVPSKCSCMNGVCGADGKCTCNRGFFLTTTGDCQACQLGCSQCSDGTGECTSCMSGFSPDTDEMCCASLHYDLR